MERPLNRKIVEHTLRTVTCGYLFYVMLVMMLLNILLDHNGKIAIFVRIE